MNRLTIAVLTTLNLFLIGCGAQVQRATSDPGATPPTSSAPNGKGRELFTKHCDACHQPSGEGGMVKVEDKRLKVPSLKSDKVTRNSDEKYADQILKGGEGMPAFKDKLTADEVKDLIRFIRQEIQGNQSNR